MQESQIEPKYELLVGLNSPIIKTRPQPTNEATLKTPHKDLDDNIKRPLSPSKLIAPPIEQITPLIEQIAISVPIILDNQNLAQVRQQKKSEKIGKIEAQQYQKIKINFLDLPYISSKSKSFSQTVKRNKIKRRGTEMGIGATKDSPMNIKSNMNDKKINNAQKNQSIFRINSAKQVVRINSAKQVVSMKEPVQQVRERMKRDRSLSTRTPKFQMVDELIEEERREKQQNLKSQQTPVQCSEPHQMNQIQQDIQKLKEVLPRGVDETVVCVQKEKDTRTQEVAIQPVQIGIEENIDNLSNYNATSQLCVSLMMPKIQILEDSNLFEMSKSDIVEDILENPNENPSIFMDSLDALKIQPNSAIKQNVESVDNKKAQIQVEEIKVQEVKVQEIKVEEVIETVKDSEEELKNEQSLYKTTNDQQDQQPDTQISYSPIIKRKNLASGVVLPVEAEIILEYDSSVQLPLLMMKVKLSKASLQDIEAFQLPITGIKAIRKFNENESYVHPEQLGNKSSMNNQIKNYEDELEEEKLQQNLNLIELERFQKIQKEDVTIKQEQELVIEEQQIIYKKVEKQVNLASSANQTVEAVDQSFNQDDEQYHPNPSQSEIKVSQDQNQIPIGQHNLITENQNPKIQNQPNLPLLQNKVAKKTTPIIPFQTEQRNIIQSINPISSQNKYLNTNLSQGQSQKWFQGLQSLQDKDFDQAFQHVLDLNDENLLVRMMCMSGPICDKLTPQIQFQLIKKIEV